MSGRQRCSAVSLIIDATTGRRLQQGAAHPSQVVWLRGFALSAGLDTFGSADATYASRPPSPPIGGIGKTAPRGLHFTSLTVSYVCQCPFRGRCFHAWL